MAKKERSLTEGPILRGVILYTLPIMLSNLIQLLFNAADLIVVGQFCGSLTVGAVGATGAITSLIINLFIGLSVGVSASVANAYGKGDLDRVSRAIHSSIPLAFVCGAMLTFIGVLFAEPLLALMKTPENVLPLSVVYMRVYFCGMIFTLLYNFSASILYALGDTKTPFLSLSMSGVLNVGLNILFVTAFDMSVMGVALATVISQALSAFFVILAICKRTDGARLIIRKCRFYWDEIQKILRIGIPAGINSSLFAISNVIIQSSINSLGDIVVVGSSASENIEAFIAVSLNSFNSAAINYTSQNYGAKNFNRIKGTFKACFACVIILGALLALIAIISAPPVLSAYITDSLVDTPTTFWPSMTLCCMGDAPR